MKKKKLEKILLKYFADSTVRAVLNGTRKPSYENMLMLKEIHKIPFTAWLDIKSYLQEHDTKTTKLEQGLTKGIANHENA